MSFPRTQPIVKQVLMERTTHSIQQPLGDHLILRSVQKEQDIARCAAFVGKTMREISGITCERILRHHPEVRYDDFLLVEDEQSGEVVSTTCLIPWRCTLDGVALDVAMLEIVATHPHFRKRGLIRAQIAAFHTTVQQQGFDLTIIEGIPYYYRQFGYAYATDHWASDTLPVSRIPEGNPTVLAALHLRRATVADIPTLSQLYDATMATPTLVTQRDEGRWRYLLTAAEMPVYLLEDSTHDRVVGYVSAWGLAGNSGIRILESGFSSAEWALHFLRWCKTKTSGQLQLSWPQSSLLVQVGRSLGSTITGADQWLLRITDPVRLLTKLAPLFAKRLAAAAWSHVTGDITINLFRQAYRLRFVMGQLVAVDPLGFVDASMGADGGDLCIPPDAFVRLVTGYRTLDQLSDAWPDIVVRPGSRHLLTTLFPLCESYFWLPFLYFGQMQPAFPVEP